MRALAPAAHRRTVAVPCFHVVFTLPEQVAAIAFYNKEIVYHILFRTVAETLLTISRDPKHLGAEIGFFSSPALRRSGRRSVSRGPVECLPSGIFLPVRVLSRLFRRLFPEALEKAHADGQLQFYPCGWPPEPGPVREFGCGPWFRCRTGGSASGSCG